MEKYISHLEDCFKKAQNLTSKISQDIIDMEGMTGTKTRHFYNNLLNIDDARYLEIGVWKGSSACSAMYKNKAKITCIDNWSQNFYNQTDSPKQAFINNFEKFKGDNDATYIDCDCFTLDINTLNSKFNIYLYDGDHSIQSQYKALNYYMPVLDDVFIFTVDDWNWDGVRQGTESAIKDLNLAVLYKKEIILTENDAHTHEIENGYEIASNTWWNGIVTYVFKKP